MLRYVPDAFLQESRRRSAHGKACSLYRTATEALHQKRKQQKFVNPPPKHGLGNHFGKRSLIWDGVPPRKVGPVCLFPSRDCRQPCSSAKHWAGKGHASGGMQHPPPVHPKGVRRLKVQSGRRTMGISLPPNARDECVPHCCTQCPWQHFTGSRRAVATVPASLAMLLFGARGSTTGLEHSRR